VRRILVADPDSDVRSLLAATLARLGYEPVQPTEDEPLPEVDAVVLEPARPDGHSLLRRFGEAVPPVICLSIYPREAGLEPPGSFAYLVKPSSRAQLGAALGLLFAV
jgi:DNA-binding response OmpR family regulator